MGVFKEQNIHCNSLFGSYNNFIFACLPQSVKPDIMEPTDGYKTREFEIGDTLNKTCRADGNPLPNVTWVKNSTGEIFGTKKGSLQLIKTLGEDDFGSYKCIARNWLGSREVFMNVEKGEFGYIV